MEQILKSVFKKYKDYITFHFMNWWVKVITINNSFSILKSSFSDTPYTLSIYNTTKPIHEVIKPTKIWASQDALHRMLSCVPSSRGPSFVAIRTQVIIVAYQALVSPSSEVSLQTWITTYTCNTVFMSLRSSHINLYWHI